jgi:hypothetical protein
VPPKTLPTPPSQLEKLYFSKHRQISNLEVLEDFSPFSSSILFYLGKNENNSLPKKKCSKPPKFKPNIFKNKLVRQITHRENNEGVP